MKITPFDISNCLCHSCGKNLCDPELTTTHELYRVTGVFGNQISYLNLSVDVPQCRDCKNNSRSTMVFPAILFVFLFAILFYCTFIVGGMTILKFLWCTLLSAVVSLISWGASTFGVKFAYHSHGLSNYKPIYIMEQYGWQHTVPGNAEEFESPYSEGQHREMLTKIVSECGCAIV